MITTNTHSLLPKLMHSNVMTFVLCKSTYLILHSIISPDPYNHHSGPELVLHMILHIVHAHFLLSDLRWPANKVVKFLLNERGVHVHPLDKYNRIYHDRIFLLVIFSGDRSDHESFLVSDTLRNYEFDI